MGGGLLELLCAPPGACWQSSSSACRPAAAGSSAAPGAQTDTLHTVLAGCRSTKAPLASCEWLSQSLSLQRCGAKLSCASLSLAAHGGLPGAFEYSCLVHPAVPCSHALQQWQCSLPPGQVNGPALELSEGRKTPEGMLQLVS